MKRLAFLLALPACLSVPSEQAPMCEVTADCDTANGEICDDGICWGNPPPGTFAAIVSPPASRTMLASKEIPQIVINPDGWIDQLELEKPVTYSTELACQAPIVCEDSMLAATITITRPSTFPGGPGFRSVVKAKGDGSAFLISVPPVEVVGTTAATYTVTIVPDGRDEMASGITPAQLLPPLRTQLTIEGNATGKVIELGGLGLPTISGVIKNDAGQPQANYRVVALGRWDPAQTPTEVSTVDFTGSDGTFQIQLSGGLTPAVELVAKPLVTTTRPTLRFAGDIGQTGQQSIQLQWPADVGGSTQLDIPVKAVEGNGEVKPARGARVILSAKVPTANGLATFTAEGVTDDTGRARVTVLDGAAFQSAGYRISFIPAAGSTAGVMYDQPFSFAAPDKQLKSRIAIRGIVRIDGQSVKDMSVTARPALKFLWSLDPAAQAFLASIPPPTSLTPESGDFVLWVDPSLVGAFGFYDLTFEAAEGSQAPTFTIPSIDSPSEDQGDYVGIYDLPFPAYVRSKITDDKGELIEGAELKLFKTEDFGSLCGEVLYPPANCRTVARAATLLGRGASDADGEVRLTLPR